MLQLFGDFGTVGGFDTPANPFQDRQTCINYYVEVAVPGAKEVKSLNGAPGLLELVHAPGGGAPGFNPAATSWPMPYSGPQLPVRGFWVLPGRLTALTVIGNTVYLATATRQGSYANPGTIVLQQVGTLNTANGPVIIRDNGKQGGYAVLVDGTYGYTYSLTSQAFAQIIDPQFIGSPTHVAFIDGWWIFNQSGGPTFYTDALPYSTAFDATLFALKDGFSDYLMGLIETKEQLWLIGETTTEIWYNAGGATFAFQRLVGTLIQTGCVARYSISRISTQGQDRLIWLGRTERGENQVILTEGLATNVVSTPAVSHVISQYSRTDDAIGWSYTEDGHEFYVLVFPTADRTWVFDATLPVEVAWSERRSYDPYSDTWHRMRANCGANFAGMRVVGDYQCGSLYQLTRAAQTDAGWPLRAVRRSPVVWDKESRTRIHGGWLQLDFAPGQGNPSGQGMTPEVSLRISRDGGATFNGPRKRGIGKIGNYVARSIWRKLSWSRAHVFELDVISPCVRDLVGATLRAET